MMKNLNIKNFLLLSISLLLVINFVSAIEVPLNATGSVVQMKTLRYEPYPVNPGEYFDFYVEVQYVGSTGSSGISFVLDPQFPFSLDPGVSAEQDFGVTNSPSIVLHYKVRVDPNAVSGTNELNLNYNVGNVWYTQSFDIDVEDAQTTFDAVIQDSSSSAVSIALANTGKNTANSVIVRIPDQDYYTTSGTNGQMVGNLASGDYSVVSFDIVRKINQQAPQNATGASGRTGIFRTQQQPENLTFDISYTDNIGVRRTVEMQLPLSLLVSNSTSTGASAYTRRNSSLPWYIFVGIVAVLLIALIIIYKKFPYLFKKLNPKNWHKKKNKSETPDWVKNSKEKERNK